MRALLAVLALLVAVVGCCAPKGCDNGAYAEGTVSRATIDATMYAVTICHTSSCGTVDLQRGVVLLSDGTLATFAFLRANPGDTLLKWSAFFRSPSAVLVDGDVYSITVSDSITHATIYQFRSAPAHYTSIDPGCGGDGCRHATLVASST